MAYAALASFSNMFPCFNSDATDATDTTDRQKPKPKKKIVLKKKTQQQPTSPVYDAPEQDPGTTWKNDGLSYVHDGLFPLYDDAPEQDHHTEHKQTNKSYKIKKSNAPPPPPFFDFAPPASMFLKPCSDYISPPPACSRFFINNQFCFLRSNDNACIHPVTNQVIGFWNNCVGKKCELLPVVPDVLVPDVPIISSNEVLLSRTTSDANRARIAGQPVALLRHKLAMKYGLHSFDSFGNRLSN